MAPLKTTRNDGDVGAFLNSIENAKRRHDGRAVLELMQSVLGEQPQMWGDSIVGFGPYEYQPKSGGSRSEWFTVGFSPRKQALTLYIMDGFSDYDALLEKLGPHSTGKSCLYIRDLEKIDREVLRDLIARSVEAVRSRHS